MNNFWIGGTEKFLLGLIAEFCRTNEVHIATVLGGGPLEPEFKKMPVSIFHASPVIFANKRLPLKLFWLLAAPVTLIRLLIFLLKVKPDAVISSLYQSDILGMSAAHLSGVKKRILVQHDIQKFGFLRKYFKSLFALHRATSIIAVSDSVRGFLVSYWRVPVEKITVIPDAINFENFASAVKPLDKKNITFGIIGRLEPVKGHRCFLEALAILKEKYKIEPKVIVAGGGPIEKDLKVYREANSLNKVEFWGPVLDAREFFRQVDVAVFPSLEEGFGLVVLEALAAKKLVVASAIGSFREIIQPGSNGILFPVDDREALAAVLKSLLDEPDRIEKYKTNLALWFEQVGYKYDLGRAKDQYEKLFAIL